MAPIVVTTEVDRSAPEVFAYATDPARFPEWQKGVVRGHTDGDRCVMTRRIGGADRTSTSRISELDPPRTWGVRGTDGPIRAAMDVTVEPVDDARSHLTIAVDFAGHGIGKVLVPLVVHRQARKEMPGNLAALKERLEAR